MGFCPFLSLRKIKQVNVTSRTINGEIVKNTGSVVSSWNPSTPEDAVYRPTSMSAATDTIDYDSTITFFDCPQDSTSDICQLWDSKNHRCGAMTSDFIYNGTDATPDAIVNIIKAVVGTYGQITSTNTLVQEFQDVIGAKAERDNNNSLVKYFQDIVGKNSEKDNAKSLIAYLAAIIGANGDITSANSFIKEFQSVVGAEGDRDVTNSLLTSFLNILGKDANRDGVNSLLTSFLNIVGEDADRDSANSLLKYLQLVIGNTTEAAETFPDDPDDSRDWETITMKIINLLKHNDLEHSNMPNEDDAANLISEFVNAKDLDNKDLSGLNPAITGSIYGTDFMIAETFSTLVLSGVTYTSKKYGAAGDLIDLIYIDPSETSQSLYISVTGIHINVYLATDASGSITTIASDIATAINGDADASKLVSAIGGAGVVTAQPITNLEGGGQGDDAPPILKAIHQHPNFPSNQTKTITWVQYVTLFP